MKPNSRQGSVQITTQVVLLLALFGAAASSISPVFYDLRARPSLLAAQEKEDELPSLPGPDIPLWRIHPIARRRVPAQRATQRAEATGTSRGDEGMRQWDCKYYKADE
jgi:hypothetical protein